MRKYLISPCGIGLGHATRMDSLMRKLDGDKLVLASGDAYTYFRNTKYRTEKIIGIEYADSQFAFDAFKTILANIDYPFSFLHNYMKLKGIADDFKPDVTISDSEPFMLLGSKFLKIPSVFVGNFPEVIDESKYMSPEERKGVKGQLDAVSAAEDFIIKNSEQVIIPSFRERARTPKNVNTVNPIIREQPENVKEIEGDYFLVTFGGWSGFNGDFMRKVLSLLRKQKEEFVVTTHLASREKKIGNLRVFPFLNNFLEYLKGCKGVISTAGHSTISEALVFGKPMMLMPIPKHVEQLSNASFIKRKELGLVVKGPNFSRKFESKLNQFVKDRDELEGNIRRHHVRGNGAEQAARIIEKVNRSQQESA